MCVTPKVLSRLVMRHAIITITASSKLFRWIGTILTLPYESHRSSRRCLMSPIIHQWYLAVYSGNPVEWNCESLDPIIVWFCLFIMSPNLMEFMENSSDPIVSHMSNWFDSNSLVNSINFLFQYSHLFQSKIFWTQSHKLHRIFSFLSRSIDSI